MKIVECIKSKYLKIIVTVDCYETFKRSVQTKFHTVHVDK